jgi:20S proteasome alpha/beta subunit
MFEGRLHQIEYALEAVKQGGAVVGRQVSPLKACVNEEI